MKALAIFLLVIFGLSFLSRLLLPVILRSMIRYLNRKARENMNEQTRYYREYVDNNNPYEETTWFGEKIKVRTKKKGERKETKTDKKNIPSVDFEDLENP